MLHKQALDKSGLASCTQLCEAGIFACEVGLLSSTTLQNTPFPPPSSRSHLNSWAYHYCSRKKKKKQQLYLYLQNVFFQDHPDTLKIWLSWSISPFPLKSGLRSMNSAKMHPTDHMSTAVEYSCSDGGRWRKRGRERGKGKGKRGKEGRGEKEGGEKEKGGRGV